VRRRSSVLALCVLLTGASVAVLATRTNEASLRPGDPPDGWYLVADLPEWPLKAATEGKERAMVEAMAETARRVGYTDARVWPEPEVTQGCWQTNPGTEASVESKCVRATSERGYVVVLRGPFGQPPDGSPDVRYEWLQRTWRQEQALAASRGLPYGVLPGIYLFSDSGRRRTAEHRNARSFPTDSAAPVVEGTDLPAGWYLALSPGAFTVDDEVALHAARVMAGQMRRAGYEDIQLVRWSSGPTCKPWGCTGRRPVVVYVVVIEGPYVPPVFSNAEEESTWREQQQARARTEATERGMVAAPFVVPLRFSALGDP
jgi:hypothetical protein